MKHTKTVTLPPTTKDVVDFVTCDLCGAKIEIRSNYEVNEVEVHHKTGNSYPECGSGEDVSVDMCGKCFDEKLVPWLRAQGVEPRTEKWDW